MAGLADKVFRLLSKKYTYSMLKKLNEGPKRFKELSSVCRIEKMRAQRLSELEKLKIVRITIKRVHGRHVPFYELSNRGKKLLKLTEEIKKICRR